MKSWKLIAVAMLAMAPAAFGAVTLSMENPADGTNKMMVGTDPFTINLVLNVDGDSQCTGVTFAVATDAAGMLRLTGREISHPVLTDPTTANGTVIGTANNLLSPKNAKDLGCGSSDGVTPAGQGKSLLMTLTFTPQGALPDPAQIMIVGVGSSAQGVWADPDFNTWALPVTTFTLTAVPEPASMLLVAVGAAFFARRRRA